ncbi:DUF5655 domain-containing protein [Phenylobacterium montanum]|uniref:DUF4287 domain-containing protein n=1 Tax=Phenylobacterium montanum TaxID=2823693 RepID=A0A975G0U2_9CAUL|nr:DUF5655 domain-containing protein [Caulobacter sp. S6]QUD88463.1 DUF4287 domain-containing protein [Caulobacter sp. S6]
MAEASLTERQRKWFESVRANLEQATGRSLPEWVAIARTCPEAGHRARLKWFKDVHGLAQNRASYVLGEAFGAEMAWDEPDKLLDALWKDPAARAVFEAVREQAGALPGVVMGARKTYTAFSRNIQFCALKPVKGGVSLGLAVPADESPRLKPRGRSENWAERLTANLLLTGPADVDGEVAAWLRQAWEAC